MSKNFLRNFITHGNILLYRTSRRRRIRRNKYHSLLGRTFLNPSQLTCQDIKSILWTAIELKTLDKNCQRVHDVRDKWVTILANHDHYYLPSMYRAAHMLNLHLCIVTIPKWDIAGNLVDLRKYYERESDMLLTHSRRHDLLTSMYTNSMIPMFNISSCKCALICVLTDLMTYQLHFGRLCGLNMLWFGEGCSLINTYIPLIHVLGLNIRYYTHEQTPSVLQMTLSDEMGKSNQIKEYDVVEDKDYCVDVMVVREKSPNWEKMLLLLKHHSQDLIFLQEFPRVDAEPYPDMLKDRQKHNERTENLKYVMASVMLRLMVDYRHQTMQPNF